MALDSVISGTGSQRVTNFNTYISGFNIAETAGTTAVVKLRDDYENLGALTCAVGGAGNGTVGLHMFSVVGVTKFGETYLGTIKEFTQTASKIYTLTAIPTFTHSLDIVGRRVYVTKAAAPTTGVDPTNAQWFRAVADGSSTIAAGSTLLQLPEATISVADGTQFAAGGGKVLITTVNSGIQVVAYTGVSTNDLTGCTGGYGMLTTGDTVTQPHLPDNSTTTLSFNVADANFPNTRPVQPHAILGGTLIERVNLAANESVGMAYPNPVVLRNGGGIFVEVNSGTVSWTLRGR